MRTPARWLLQLEAVMTLALSVTSASVLAQGSMGSISGTLSDVTRATLPGVTVTVSGQSIVGLRSTVTAEVGQYRLPGLPAGTYRLRYELRGFWPVVRDGIVVQPGATATVNVQLRVRPIKDDETATWFRLYDEGLEHLRLGELEAAELKIQAAKRKGPRPNPRALRYGSLRTPFFPDYYLGVVYQSTNRPKEAVAAFQLAKSQNIETTAREFQQLDSFIRTAEAAVARTGEPPVAKGDPTAPEPKPGGAVTPEQKVAIPTSPTSPADSGAAARRKRFDDLMAQAQTQLSQRNYTGALTSAEQARDLQVDRANAEAMIESITRANLADQTKSLADQIRTDIQNQDLTSANLKLDRLKQVAPTSTEIPALSEAIGAASSKLDAVGRRVAAERNAMRLFYGGDYQGALLVLGDLEKTQSLSSRAYFYRACSLAALALRGASVDQPSQLSEARRQYAQAVRAPNEFQRDRRFISPKILQELEGRSAK